MTTVQPDVTPNGRYSVKECAAKLCVCENTIYNWLNGGVFKSHEFNKRAVGHKGIYIKGAALRRVWGATMY